MKTNFWFRGAILGVVLSAAVSFKAVCAQVFPIATNQSVMEFGGGLVFDGTNYLAGVVLGNIVAGQPLTAGGQVAGAPVVVGANPGFPPLVAMAGVGTNALVAWSDGSLSSGATAFGRLVSAAGAGPQFPLLATVGSHGFQAVQAAASDGTNFLVVWRDMANNTFNGQFVTGAGVLSGAEFLLFSPVAPIDDRNLALTFGGTHYLLAWQDGANNTNHTYCKLIAPSGSVGATVQITGTPSLEYNPSAVAFDGTNYLVVWNRATNSTVSGASLRQLCGRLVSQSGVALGTERVLVTEQSVFPALAFDGDNYLLAWGFNTLTTNNDITIHARFLDRSANPIGPIFTPFSPQGSYPPLIPLNGVHFDGSRYVLTATYGSLVLDEFGDMVGFLGGDVYGAFLPRSTTPPVFTNGTVVDGLFQAQLLVVPGMTYTIELATNLPHWTAVATVSSDETSLLDLVDEEPAANHDHMFYRAVVGSTLGVSHGLFFLEFADAGGFGGGFTPTPSFPVTLGGYSASFDVENDVDFPAATNVFFTGPAGSGLSNTSGDPGNSNVGLDYAAYQSPVVSSPAAAPGGTWMVNYKGANYTYNIPDPQADARLVIPLPTVSVSGDQLQSVSWVYRDAATGGVLAGAPAYVTELEVQIEGVVGGRIYESDELAPGVSNHILTSPVNWSNVNHLFMAYSDTLGNHYVVMFSNR